MKNGKGFAIETVLEKEDVASALFCVGIDARRWSLVGKEAEFEGPTDFCRRSHF